MSEYQQVILNNLYRNKKVQLQSTRYLQNLHFPTHDYNSSQDQQNSELSESIESEGRSDFGPQQNLDEDVIVHQPYIHQKLNLISSFSKPSKSNLLKSIDQNKKNYNELLKKKEQNRQKFIQKINKNLNQSHSIFLSSNPSVKNLEANHKKGSRKESNLKTKNILRSQTEENKSKKVESAKDTQSNWDKNSQIDFNLTSQRQGSEQKIHQKSAKKKITIKRKLSVNSSIKEKVDSKILISQMKEQADKKDSALNKSVNEFMFMEQYQKDQKQIMSRLLSIIEQDHQNRIQNVQIKQSLMRESEGQFLKMSKMKQKSLNSSVRFQCAPIQTQYSSVKPIVINNYIKSPTQFMGKGLIERQMAIKMLEQNRNNKKKSMISSVADSRILNESAIVGLVSRQQEIKKQKSKPQMQVKPNSQNQLDFELLYQKLKNQAEKQKTNNQGQKQKQTKSQSKNIQLNDETEKKSELMLPINSSRPSKPTESIQQSAITNQNTFTSHNISQNLTEFNPNVSVQSQQNFQFQYNFKKPSVSMQISFGNQNEPNESISLADAFKKKFGANKFGSKGKSLPKQANKSKNQTEALSQLKDFQNTNELGKHKKNDLGENQISFKKENPSGKKTIKVSKKSTSIRDKQNLNSLQTPRSYSQHYNSTERSVCTNMSKQPSKQLLDRLIYGQKVTMTKKEMYELSKKNYMKLPEIEEKKKQEEKRLKQIQRQQKIKQYQKRIRSSKNSICKDSLKNSLESSFIKS